MSGSGGYQSPNFSIPYTMPSNVPPEAQPYINPIYLALQNLIYTLINYAGIAPRSPSAILSSINDPTAILSANVHRFYTQATETINQGSAVNLYASAGTLFARNAIATDMDHRCDGFCSQTGGLANGQVGEIILNDGSIYTGITTAVAGTRYYLSPTTPGAYTSTKPTTAGQIVQYLGIGISANAIRFWTGEPVQL